MPDVKNSRTLQGPAEHAGTKAGKLYRYIAGSLCLCLAAGTAVVVASPDLRAQSLAGQRADVAEAPAIKKSALIEEALAATAKNGDAAVHTAQVTLHELRQYIGLKYKVPSKSVKKLVDTAWEVGHSMQLDPLLLLAVMAVESSFNPRAESKVGAQGLMQVMTRIHHKKFEPYGGRQAAWQPDANIHVGAQILKECIARRGSVPGGLTCYVGAAGTSSKYGQKVLAERKRFAATVDQSILDGTLLALEQTSAKPGKSAAPAVRSASRGARSTAPAQTDDAVQVAGATQSAPGKARKADSMAPRRTVDEDAAAIVENSSGHLALNEVTATLTLRDASVEM